MAELRASGEPDWKSMDVWLSSPGIRRSEHHIFLSSVIAAVVHMQVTWYEEE